MRLPLKEIGVLVVTLLVFLLIGEGVIRFYLSQNIVYDIEMTRYSLALKQDSDNPLIGHVHKPNRSARLMGSEVQINSDGFRDDDYTIAKNNKERIIFLGDSLTFGWGVEKEESFEHALEKQFSALKPTEIINFGTGNYNTEQEVNLFLEKGLKYNPDRVVLFYFINDAEVTPAKSNLWFLGYSEIITFYWSRIHAAMNNLFSSMSFQEYYANLYQDESEGWGRTKNAFLKLKEVCAQEQIDLKVILLPELHDTKNYPFKGEYALVSDFLSQNKIAHLDLSPSFVTVEDPVRLWVALDDAHPNAEAHRMIADHSFDFLKGAAA